MKKLLLILFLAPLFLFSKEDTLYKKRINLIFGFDLSIPQQRNEVGFSDKSYPNSVRASPTNPIYTSIIYRNAWNLSLGVDIKLYKKLYFQTGFYVTALYDKSHIFEDSLGKNNNIEVNTMVWTNKIYNFTIPIGLQYRITKRIFASAGATGKVHSIDVQGSANYHDLVQITPNDKNTLVNNQAPYFVKYIAANINLFTRTYLNLKLSTTTFKSGGFKENLYYSIGFRFFII